MSDGKRIGLLGGSFNPAHQGHLHISRAALDRLKLNEVWWVVSPQNPLKDAHGMGDFQSRIRSAKDMADDPRIIVSDIEQKMGTVYTVDTLEVLKKKFPEHRFVWLMGADNLRQIPKWRGWQRIFRMVPIAIFPRPSYSRRALAGKASRRFKRSQIKAARASRLATMRAPVWVFLRTQPNTTSATRIRAQLAREESQ
ncbi:MAG: hypothetical protein CBD27_10450 [Rhodospirillaceae bacterium TMED167]|nr:nicotinic acid mononucleotide adenylyltransferase [Rhodospirillaceae bacterium]OUW24869.1 MAG: hypothetical protein CBD27_10450 [Rhodospirillaceae bacterium TMED167]